MMTFKKLQLSIAFLFVMLPVYNCNAGNINRKLHFGMSIEEVRKLGYLASDEPVQYFEHAGFEDEEKIISNINKNGIVEYVSKVKSIEEYIFDYAALGFANDILAQIIFKKVVNKSSLENTYYELKAILDSYFGSANSKNKPDFSVLKDTQVLLNYHKGSAIGALSLHFDKRKGYENNYDYHLEIRDVNRYNSAGIDLVVAEQTGGIDNVKFSVDVPINGPQILVDSIMIFLNKQLYDACESNAHIVSDENVVLFSREEMFTDNAETILSHYIEKYKPLIQDNLWRIFWLSIKLEEQTDNYVTYGLECFYCGANCTTNKHYYTFYKANGNQVHDYISTENLVRFMKDYPEYQTVTIDGEDDYKWKLFSPEADGRYEDLSFGIFADKFSLVINCCCGYRNPVFKYLPYSKIFSYLSSEAQILVQGDMKRRAISASDFLNLPEGHSVEEMLFNYNNTERAEEYPEYVNEYLATHRDSAAIRLANSFERMGEIVMRGNANDKLQWAMAVNTVLDTFHVAVPSLPKDSTLNEIERVVDKFSSDTQAEINFQFYITAMVDYYRTIESYRQWILAVPSNIRSLAQEEYEAWHDLNNARFALWKDVSFRQIWYSAKPMQIEGYREYLSSNRRAELEVERGILLENKSYRQKCETVTTQEWEKWIADNSVPVDIDDLKKWDETDLIPSDSIVQNRVNSLKSTFARWMKARRAFAAALPKEQSRSYSNLTADIHCKFIDKEPTYLTFNLAFNIVNPYYSIKEKSVENLFEGFGLQKIHKERYVWDTEWGGDSPAISYCYGDGVDYQDCEMKSKADDYYGVSFSFFFDGDRKKGHIEQFSILTSSRSWYEQFMKNAKDAQFTYTKKTDYTDHITTDRYYTLMFNDEDDELFYYIIDNSANGKYEIEIGFNSYDL